MSSTSAVDLTGACRGGADRLGDRGFRYLTLSAVLGSLAVVTLLVYKVFDLAAPAIDRFGLGFLVERTWNPVTGQFGALELIVGTAVTSLGALLLAAPISIAIALFLTELTPARIATPVAALVEVLAGIPSVVIGLWGILILGPFLRDHVEPALGDGLGWIPLFSGTPNASSVFTAIVVLTIMIVPIVTSIARELFLRVPGELKQGALALGTTRWEMVRGVMFPYARAGVASALILGLGRAVGEAIAVTQVVGGTAGIHWSLFSGGDTLASRIAAQYQGASSDLQVGSLAYLAVILLVLSLLMNLGARLIVGRMGSR
ncbi:MAG TPA: phosphate ABC transporter permease subunit PstC [Polyangia bacterium]